MLKQERML